MFQVKGLKAVVSSGQCAFARSLSAVPATEATVHGHKFFELLEDAEKAYPYKEAISVPFQDLRWSFKTLREYAESTAKGFFELGFRKGDNIVALLPGNMERLNAQAAASLIGAHVITLDASFANANDLAHVLKDTQTRGLIFDERFGGKNVRLLEQMIPCLKEGEDGFDQSPYWNTGLPLDSDEFPKLKKIIKCGVYDHSCMLRYDTIFVNWDTPVLPAIQRTLSTSVILGGYYEREEGGGLILKTQTNQEVMARAKQAISDLNISPHDKIFVKSFNPGFSHALAVTTLSNCGMFFADPTDENPKPKDDEMCSIVADGFKMTRI